MPGARQMAISSGSAPVALRTFSVRPSRGRKLSVTRSCAARISRRVAQLSSMPAGRLWCHAEELHTLASQDGDEQTTVAAISLVVIDRPSRSGVASQTTVPPQAPPFPRISTSESPALVGQTPVVFHAQLRRAACRSGQPAASAHGEQRALKESAPGRHDHPSPVQGPGCRSVDLFGRRLKSTRASKRLISAPGGCAPSSGINRTFRVGRQDGA